MDVSIETVLSVVQGLGIPENELSADRRIRADLGLDSTEITEIELALESRIGEKIDLWQEPDYSLGEIAQKMEAAVRRPDRTAAHDAAAYYRAQGWWRDERIDELALRHRTRLADRPAVIDGVHELSHAELAAAVHRTARRLSVLGLRRGDRVLVQLPNAVEQLVIILALVRAGMRPVLAMSALRTHELDHVLEVTQPTALAVPRRSGRFDHLGMAQELRQRHDSVRLLLVSGCDDALSGDDAVVDLSWLCLSDDAEDATAADDVPGVGDSPDDTALFLLSSGTTGPPKAIPRTHEAFGHVIRSAAEVSGMSEETVYLAVMPAAHSFVFSHPGILGTLASGGRVVLGTPDHPLQALEILARHRVTHCALVPTLVRQWSSARESAPDLDISSLEVLQVGGARLDAATAERATELLGCRIQQVYGMSEGQLNFTRLDDPEDVVRNTQGRPSSPGDDYLVVDDSGAHVADGEMGEFLVRGPGVITGYHGEEEANARAFTPDGFYRTGDLVRRDPSGNLVVVGRVKDVINRAGDKIAADELEALVTTHPRVEAAAAVAMPHPLYGEAVCLYAVPADDSSLELHEIRRFLESQGIARFKLPERLRLLETLPTVGVGKIDKTALRKDIATLVAAERPGQHPTPPSGSVA